MYCTDLIQYVFTAKYGYNEGTRLVTKSMTLNRTNHKHSCHFDIDLINSKLETDLTPPLWHVIRYYSSYRLETATSHYLFISASSDI